MQIAILGAGRIGSTFAWRLGRAGHDVTLIARGKRLEELQKDPAITSVDDERVPVKVAAALDPATPYDLALVTVLAHQVEPLLPSLKASSAKTVMFMFNTVASLAPLRDAVGAERFAFGFPTIIAFFENGKLRSSVSSPGLETTVTSEPVRKVFEAAGFPAVLTDDMESWLRAHAAFVIPLMLAGCVVEPRKRGLSWAEAQRFSAAFVEGFTVVRHLGNKVIPSSVAMMERLPHGFATFAIWLSSRTASVIDLGKMGPTEPVALIDAFTALAPDKTAAMRAIRP